MNIKQHYLILVFAFFTFSLNVHAQNLTDFDKSQIERRAKLKMDEFEELLFLISDPTRSRGAIERYILSSYSGEDSLFNQVFYNEEVMIEDDITPIVLTNDNIEVSAIDVATYLNNFKLQYGKYIDKTVFFTNLSFSEVEQGDNIYIVVTYDSEFKGKNTNFNDYTYPKVKRQATLRAEYNYQSDTWQVWIAGVNFDRNTSEPNTIPDEPKTDIAPVTMAQEEKINNEPLLDQPEENLPNLQFTTSFPESIKKGKSLPLKWNESVDNANISLYQGEQEVMSLRKDLYGQQWNWNIQQKPGKNYSISLYEPATNREVRSSSFQVKPRFPLALKVGIPLAAIGVAVLLLNDSDPGPGPEKTQELAEPPGLPTN